MLQARNACLLAVLALVLSACTKDQTSFPSLARRPAERISADPPPPPPPPPPAAPSAALLEKVEALLAAARSADARFNAAQGKASSLTKAAAGAEIASEDWSVAVMALSELETRRSQVMIALADLDALYAGAVVDGADSQVLQAARQVVLDLVEQEDRVLGELNGLLKN